MWAVGKRDYTRHRSSKGTNEWPEIETEIATVARAMGSKIA
jgi:hypothetical protein